MSSRLPFLVANRRLTRKVACCHLRGNNVSTPRSFGGGAEPFTHHKGRVGRSGACQAVFTASDPANPVAGI